MSDLSTNSTDYQYFPRERVLDSDVSSSSISMSDDTNYSDVSSSSISMRDDTNSFSGKNAKTSSGLCYCCVLAVHKHAPNLQ